MHILYLTTDLMFSSQVSGLVRAKGGESTVVSTAADLIARASAQEAALVILDLSLAGLDSGQIVHALRAMKQAPQAILAYAPHVHEAKLAAAREAGCDQVLTRGGFHREIASILDCL